MKREMAPSDQHRHHGPGNRFRGKLAAVLVGFVAAMGALPDSSAVDIAAQPLSIGRQVPGNLTLVPSVEFPTLISVANFGDYDPARTYVGYFDAGKCYRYVYDDTESLRHFAPDSATGKGHACTGALWSGNYMNWAATQTIDPFRSALTGGYRVRDTTTETWLEKAKADRDGNENTDANFPRRTYPGRANATAVNAATPAQWGTVRSRIDGLGNRMRFTSGGNAAALGNNDPGTGQPVAYNPATHTLDASTISVNGGPVKQDEVVFEVSVRVAVCVTGMLEANCNAGYSGVAKPEGLIQEYSKSIRYSIFGYLNNDRDTEPDGGVMRARQKFVGPSNHFPDVSGAQANPNREWDPATGILYPNPDPGDASATNAGINHSGVINYLNRFGQMETGRNAKSYDNVSELYYAALRYFKNQGNVPAYSNGVNGSYQMADGFPVITDWDDPIRYSCQANVIIGVGDTNTWRDKNLPGPTSAVNENTTKPAEVEADTSVNVVAMLKNIWRMEGYDDATATTMAAPDYFNVSAHNNSAYIAALAYDAHTRDIRPASGPRPVAGKQTVSTYWVDVVENRGYKTPHTNQYWLAAKYGGFAVPAGFNPDTHVTPLADSQWWATNEYVNNDNNFKRPTNFYVAAQADKMVESLKQAFARIVQDMRGSGGSFASNTTKLETGAMTYQAQFYSGSWRGELVGYQVNQTTGALTQAWTAGSQFPANFASRNIWINNAGTMQRFTTMTQAPALGSQAVVDYIRGDRTNEAPNGSLLRTRQGVLGDIINSQPVYVGAPNPRLFYGTTFSGTNKYGAFVQSKASRTPVIYVGANDGMLHGFNATTGAETFAFIPKEVIPRLARLTDPGYTHEHFVDGDLTVADAYWGNAWRSVLVGTLGRGGKSVFALDVTDPANVTFLWEKNATDIPALGNVLGKPVIAQVANGDWRVFLGNGPNSMGGNAQLISIRLDTGTVTTADTGVGGDNGLSGVNVWSSGTTEYADVVYAGDLKGNLWKLTNLSGAMTATRLFQASRGGTAQSITAAPAVSRNPANNDLWIHFGTGRYLSEVDLSDSNVQTWYGIIDRGTTVTRANLREVDIEAEVAPTANSLGARVVESVTGAVPNGWYIDLVSPTGGAQGERMVVPNLFQGLVLVGTTRIPDNTDVCNPSGRGWVMAINPFTGGRLVSSFFDMNGDGRFDSNDLVNGQPNSGVGLPSGPNNPIFIGNVMLTNMDNAESNVIRIQSQVMMPSRVSWREVVGD